MKKVKRYNEEGYVTSDDSNSGMKEAYDEGAPERANSSEDSQAIMNEAKGEGMLKSMRDEAAKPKMTKPKVMAKTTPKTSNYSNEGRSTPAPAAKPDVTKMSLSERMKASRESARSGSGKTDTRSVSERLRSAFGMASGGSASSRADGIASRGKTRGKMC
jgi:hypothetical protein